MHFCKGGGGGGGGGAGRRSFRERGLIKKSNFIRKGILT